MRAPSVMYWEIYTYFKMGRVEGAFKMYILFKKQTNNKTTSCVQRETAMNQSIVGDAFSRFCCVWTFTEKKPLDKMAETSGADPGLNQSAPSWGLQPKLPPLSKCSFRGFVQ